jgi:hypothetical protein
MPVGAASERVTVEGGAPLLNIEAASVNTLIGQRGSSHHEDWNFRNFVASALKNG